MKKKKGFTLVELLAVIVILAVILIIAMPKISDVIKNSKESSLETTAKLIASQAEKKYTENQVLDNSSTIKCSDVAKISNADYESCNITFDDKGNAKVTIVGKGKFEGMAVCNANKNSATVSSDCSTNASYFTYEDTTIVTNVIVEDANKCKSYIQTKHLTEEQATTLCTEGSITIGESTGSLKDLVVVGAIPSSDYETVGLRIETKDGISITGYNIEGGTDVVIPSQIDGKTVVAIGGNAFFDSNTGLGLGITSVIIPNTITSIGVKAFKGNKLTNVTIPSSVTLIGNSAFANNKLTNVEIPSSITGIGNYAFADNKITSVIIPNTVTSIGVSAFEGNKLTNVTIPSSVTGIGHEAFKNNKITSITFPDTPVILGCRVFDGNPIMEDQSYSFPSNVTVSCVIN